MQKSIAGLVCSLQTDKTQVGVGLIIAFGGIMDEEEVGLMPIPEMVKLEDMSIEELTELIATLEGSIVRARKMITSKQKVRGDAEQVFG